MAKPEPSKTFLRALPDGDRPAARAPATLGAYPQVRMRRNRSHAWTRRLVAENRLSVDDLIWPIFVQDLDGASEVASMP